MSTQRRAGVGQPRGRLQRIGAWLDQPRVLAWLMLGPAVLYVIAFVGFPFLLAIALSMSDATIGDPSLDTFVGLDNFRAVIQTDAFKLALRNSLIVTAGTLGLVLVLATLASELLVHAFRGKRLFQMIFILPWALPVSLTAIVWMWFLDSTFSPVDWVLVKLNLLGPGGVWGPFKHMYFLGSEWLGLASVIVTDTWRMLPLATIIVLAARMSIPEERFEQARVDGAGVFRILFRITLPALKPMLIVAILFTGLLVVGEMSLVQLLTRGGPGHSTQVLPYWAYLKGIQGGSLAQGAAITLFLFPFLSGLFDSAKPAVHTHVSDRGVAGHSEYNLVVGNRIAHHYCAFLHMATAGLFPVRAQKPRRSRHARWLWPVHNLLSRALAAGLARRGCLCRFCFLFVPG